MANVILNFFGIEKFNSKNRIIKSYVNSEGGLLVDITNVDLETHESQYTVLDKPTAVRLVKELKRQIALMD